VSFEYLFRGYLLKVAIYENVPRQLYSNVALTTLASRSVNRVRYARAET